MSLLKNERGLFMTVPFLMVFGLIFLVGIIAWAFMDPLSKIVLMLIILSVSIVAIAYLFKRPKVLESTALAPFLSGGGATMSLVNESVVISTVGAGEAMPLLMTFTAFVFIAAGFAIAIVMRGKIRGRGGRR